ncbi:unnamed protein product, partial [Trichogramma brassicae]
MRNKIHDIVHQYAYKDDMDSDVENEPHKHQSPRREWKICLESERSSSVRAERDILGDVYVGLTSTARVVRSYVARVKSASAGTSRPECARENQWIQRPSRPQGQPRVDLDQEKISTSCGESGGPAFGRCICESYAPTRPPGRRSSRLPSTGYSGDPKKDFGKILNPRLKCIFCVGNGRCADRTKCQFHSPQPQPTQC